MTKTPSASATPYTCSNEKSFWIPVEYTPKICTSYCACQNFIFFFKITFEKHPNLHILVHHHLSLLQGGGAAPLSLLQDMLQLHM